MNEMKLIPADEIIVCDQCGALVLKDLKNTHGQSHQVFGSFSEVPADLLVTYNSPEDLSGFDPSRYKKQED